MPLPTFMDLAPSTNLSTNSRNTSSCTSMRVGEMQTWPALRYFAADRIFAADVTSASLKTIAGACPPNSMVARFMCNPASADNCLPTTVEPVKEILRITGCGIRYSEISEGTP